MQGLVLVVLVAGTGLTVVRMLRRAPGQSMLSRNLAVLKVTFLWVKILPNSFLTVA